MRLVVPELDLFHGGSLPHEHARELEVMDQILCANPTIVRWVWKDLQGHVEKGPAAVWTSWAERSTGAASGHRQADERLQL